ncbi:MAG TPA: nitroreductase family deazaflavin-dependent oxidoreductase, partial [Cryobacterium sp.]|nr:nitroreductase family deazaflavin-dependent oxidoreductase [Cryobacterium sp.]
MQSVGWYARAGLSRAMRSRAARRIAPSVIPRLHLALFHLTDGRIHLSAALVPSLVLHTEGA